MQRCTRKSDEEVYMFCDSESAIEAVNKVVFNNCPDTFIKLRNLLYQLKVLSVCVKLINVPAHIGIFGNYMAGQKAKELSLCIFKGYFNPEKDAI